MVSNAAAQPTTVLNPGSGTVLTVGAGCEFATLADAVNAAQSGNTIAVKAGTYTNDFVNVTKNLHIVAVGGLVNEVATQPPPNDKGLITVDANLSIQGFTFTGGSDGSPDGNVAGIRLESGNLSVAYCDFHNMQEGLLADPDPGASVTIDHSEFSQCGTGDGYSHDLYVGSVGTLTITNSFFTQANVGHEIKSRAQVTNISNNVIADGVGGTASYDIDIPNGGVANITDNVIEKGASASNTRAIHYGGETQYAYASNALNVTGNTIINDLGPQGVAVYNQSTVNGLNVVANIANNKLYGFAPGNVGEGANAQSGNTTLATNPGFSTASPLASLPSVVLANTDQVVNLVNQGHTVSGGTSRLTVNDHAGSNTIQGGAGGLLATAAANFAVITTASGSRNTLNLTGNENTVTSHGADVINSNGAYEAVTAMGAATINGAGFSSYVLDGTGEHLNLTSSSLLTVGGAASVALVDNGGDTSLTLSAGGRLTIDDLAATTHGAAASTATITGGASGTSTNNGSITLTTGASGANIVAGTGIVSITGGTGADTLTAGSGTDHFVLGSGKDHVVFGSGSASVTGGSGADIYVFEAGVAGQATITGFKQGTDSLQFNGFSGSAISSGTIVSGSTVLTLSDGASIDLVGVALPGYAVAPGNSGSGGGSGGGGAPAPAPVSSNGTTVLATGGHVLQGGATALIVNDLAGGNTIEGGAHGVSGSFRNGDMITTAAGSANTLLTYSDDTITGAGSDSIDVSGVRNRVSETGTAQVALAAGGSTVQGGAGLLSVTDQAGGCSIIGGAGGLAAQLAGIYDTVSTAVGATDSVAIGGYGTLLSQGHDTITVSGNYGYATVTGAASITSANGSASYVLDGADSLKAVGGGQVTVGASANVAIASAGQSDLTIDKLAGGTASVSDSLAGGLASLSVHGGAATISAATGYYAGLSAHLGAGASVSAGTGNMTLTGGAGQDVFTGGTGNALITLGTGDTVCLGSGEITAQGGSADMFMVAQASTGTLVIDGWSAGDTITSASITQQSVSGGNTWLSLSGGAQIELVGVSNFH